ncbi:unnamed protein product [Sphenostylis stenocarpa]|uniref:Uncharacterized protein n=1 Tax=Sphenostylis stenocarpa TaxID=92480 RepID=A0AA86T7A4_9FABA|nr:unnamed protein product [Sphenostylis stenocarpa]
MKPCPTNPKDLEYRSSCRYDMWVIGRPITGRISRNFEIWGCGIIRFKICDGLPIEDVICEDLSSRNSGASAINFWEKPNIGATTWCF